MKKLSILKVAVLVLALSACVFSGCGKNNSEEAAATTAPEVEQEYIIVGTDDDGVTPLIFYNLNMASSIEELGEYLDLGYDFENKPVLFLAQADAPEGVFEQIIEMLDEKGVEYLIIEE